MGQLIERSCLDLVDCLKDGETSISGLEKISRLKEGAKRKQYVLLDSDDLKLFIAEQDSAPEEWKEKIDGKTMQIYFHGKLEVDENTDEERYRFLWWSGKRWQTGSNVATAEQNAATPSAIIRVR